MCGEQDFIQLDELIKEIETNKSQKTARNKKTNQEHRDIGEISPETHPTQRMSEK